MIPCHYCGFNDTYEPPSIDKLLACKRCKQSWHPHRHGNARRHAIKCQSDMAKIRSNK